MRRNPSDRPWPRVPEVPQRSLPCCRKAKAKAKLGSKLRRRPDRTSQLWQRCLQLRRAEFRRRSRVVSREPCTSHRRPGKRLKSPRDFASFKHSLCSWNDRPASARQSDLAGRRQKSSHVEEPCPFFPWRQATHEASYPSSLEHFVGFFRVRASEPCNGGASRNVNRTFSDFHEVTGTEQVNRLTATPLYGAVYKEILASCESGRPVKQAPRFPVGLLALVRWAPDRAIEED